MSTYKQLAEKQKELIALLDDMNYSTMVDKEQWTKRKELYNEIKQIEEAIEKEERRRNDPNLCTVCHSSYVDSADGFDTCDYCANKL